MGFLLALAAAASAWNTTRAPHFEISHEEAFMPPGFLVTLEKIHSRLRLDLSMFSPWMAKERINLYLYKDRDSYLKGEFHPPEWSDGLAIPQLKAVALPDRADRKNLAQIAAHEMTHLLFQSWWDEAKKQPPSWLDEGLAMLEEDEPGQPSVRLAVMAYAERSELIPMERFFELTPTKDIGSGKTAERYYNQAYGVTRFLYRHHSKLQFKAFCGHLRDGKTPQQALWLTYRYATLEKFEKAFLAWLTDPARKAEAQPAVQAAARLSAPQESRKSAKFAPMTGFKSLQE